MVLRASMTNVCLCRLLFEQTFIYSARPRVLDLGFMEWMLDFFKCYKAFSELSRGSSFKTQITDSFELHYWIQLYSYTSEFCMCVLYLLIDSVTFTLNEWMNLFPHLQYWLKFFYNRIHGQVLTGTNLMSKTYNIGVIHKTSKLYFSQNHI